MVNTLHFNEVFYPSAYPSGGVVGQVGRIIPPCGCNGMAERHS